MSNLITQIGGPTILIFIGGLIAALGAVLSAIEQNKASAKIEQKNEEIIRLNRDISSAITGGDSFCYLRPGWDGKITYTYLFHSGTYPVYDLSARIVDCDLMEKVQVWTRQNIQQAEMNVELGSMAPNSVRELGSILPTDSSFKRFNIFISARNGFVNEKLRMHRLESGAWATAIQVSNNTKEGATVTLLEEVSPEYPREPDGTVKWD